MREARIIVPDTDNDGKLTDDVKALVERTLTGKFGGFTSTSGFGGWSNNGTIIREPVTVYDVATEDTADNRAILDGLAYRVLLYANQDAVYLRYPGGNVKIVERVAAAEAA